MDKPSEVMKELAYKALKNGGDYLKNFVEIEFNTQKELEIEDYENASMMSSEEIKERIETFNHYFEDVSRCFEVCTVVFSPKNKSDTSDDYNLFDLKDLGLDKISHEFKNEFLKAVERNIRVLKKVLLEREENDKLD